MGEFLGKLGRHNMRPNHLHMMFVKGGYNTLTTALYPDGDEYITSDAVFGVKKSLVVVCIGTTIDSGLFTGCSLLSYIATRDCDLRARGTG